MPFEHPLYNLVSDLRLKQPSPDYYSQMGMVRVRIGGEEIDSIKVRGGIRQTSTVRPNSLISFSYTRKLSGANTVTLTVLDSSFHALEQQIMDFRDQLEISYGYSGGYMTPWLSFFIMDYTPVITDAGIEVTMECISLGGLNFTKRHRDFTGTPSDIVKLIAEENKWNVNIQDTLPIMGAEGLVDAALSLVPFVQTGTSDLNFIRDILIPSAASENERFGSFYAWFEDLNNTFNFRQLDWLKESNRRYSYLYGDENSIVSEWNPAVNGAWLASLGGVELIDGNVDRETGLVRTLRDRTIEAINAAVLTPESARGGFLDLSVDFGKQITSDTLFYFTGISFNGEHSRRLAEQRFSVMREQILTSEMTTMGDPEVRPDDIVDVDVVAPNGIVHYSSGKWKIAEIEDSIQTGDFKSKMTLWRVSQSFGSQPADSMGEDVKVADSEEQLAKNKGPRSGIGIER